MMRNGTELVVFRWSANKITARHGQHRLLAALPPAEAGNVSAMMIGYLVGSLAKGSINRKLAKALVRLAPPELQMTEISFKDLPLYNYDYDSDFPPVARAFKDAIAAVDAVLFVTPEYNRSIPGGLRMLSTGRAAPTARTPLPTGLPRSSEHRRARSERPSPSRACAACSAFAIRRR